MTSSSKKLLENHALGLVEQVATQRLKRAGVKLGSDLGLPLPKTITKADRLSPRLIKRLAGG